MKGRFIMKNSIKKKISSVVSKVGYTSGMDSTGEVCFFYLYQPKQPKALKKATRK